MTSPTLTQIIVIIAVVIGLIIAMRLIQPKLSAKEKYLLGIIQRKSPQRDNIHLFMWTKMVVHPIHQAADLEYQKEILADEAKFKMLQEQLYGFGAFALYTIFGYEAINWFLQPEEEDPLFQRLAALLVLRRFPHTAAVIESLISHSPDAITEEYLSKNAVDSITIEACRTRYVFLLKNVLDTLTHTSRNEWWPGVSADIREWAENQSEKLMNKYSNILAR